MRDSARTIRRWLVVVLALGALGVGAELVLIEHDEDLNQLIPLIALAVGLAAFVWDALARRRASRLALRLAMVGLMASAVAGLYLHYSSNEEFQRELDPSLEGWQLALATMRAQSPPALAPGVMGLLGALGWITTLGRKPASEGPSRTLPEDEYS